MLELNEKWMRVLGSLPESGMGYHVVNIKLKDGSSCQSVIVYNCRYAKIATIDNEDIDGIESCF